MMKIRGVLGTNFAIAFVCLVTVCFCSLTTVYAQESSSEGMAVFGEEPEVRQAYDPLEPLNRVFFHFNDKLYFWVMKPVSRGYAYVIPEDIRMCLRDFVKNILAPVRIVNNLLQGKIVDSGVEVARFVVNSTLGIGGLADPAREELGLMPKDEDLGQTLGVYGLGGGVYFCWPFFGPSNMRDTLGMAGDFFLNPFFYLSLHDSGLGLAAQGGKEINETSLTIRDYEDFRNSAIDPYVALRDAYSQYRQKKILDITAGSHSMYSSMAVFYVTEQAAAGGKRDSGLSTAESLIDGGELAIATNLIADKTGQVSSSF